MPNIRQLFPAAPTNADLIAAIEGYRMQLDAFCHRTGVDLIHLREALQRRIDEAARK